MADYINISAFFIGISTAFFSIFAVHILFMRDWRTRFQTVLGGIMAVWALWNLKDIVITFPGMYTQKVLNWILIIDGWSALTYTVLVFEAVMPGWVTLKRLLLLMLPFSLFTVAYGIWPIDEVVYAYVAFLWCYAWAIVGVGYVKMNQHLAYVRRNFSNIDRIDVSWLKPVFSFAIISQLAWLFTSLYATVYIDIIYYVTTLLLWLLVLYYSWDFQPIVAEQDTETLTESQSRKVIPLAEGLLEQVVENEKLYLKKDLTLSELAVALNTNRTYVSSYLSQVRQQTFYDYINQLRIEKMSIPLMKEHPEYKLEFVASESGFASISTFRRSFIKLTGQTPSQFVVE